MFGAPSAHEDHTRARLLTRVARSSEASAMPNHGDGKMAEIHHFRGGIHYRR